jgi:hypothetical protein
MGGEMTINIDAALREVRALGIALDDTRMERDEERRLKKEARKLAEELRECAVEHESVYKIIPFPWEGK